MYKTIKSYLETSIILYTNYVMVIKPDRPISDVTDILQCITISYCLHSIARGKNSQPVIRFIQRYILRPFLDLMENI